MLLFNFVHDTIQLKNLMIKITEYKLNSISFIRDAKIIVNLALFQSKATKKDRDSAFFSNSSWTLALLDSFVYNGGKWIIILRGRDSL